MKFAEHLGAHITPEWRKQYIQYEVSQLRGAGFCAYVSHSPGRSIIIIVIKNFAESVDNHASLHLVIFSSRHQFLC